ncbi:unnamed protein product, partial [Discosporangium mesarthrocarpum]
GVEVGGGSSRGGAVGQGRKAKRKQAAGERGADAESERIVRHLSVDFICAFMDSGDPSVHSQMLAGARGGGILSLPLRGALWRDPPNTALLYVETLSQGLLLNRRVSRKSKVEFFTLSNIEQLRKVFDSAPAPLYKALQDLLRSLLCDPATSPFLTAQSLPRSSTASSAGFNQAGRQLPEVGRDLVVIHYPRVLLKGLACLGGHEDLGQRQLVLEVLTICPCLFPGYLRTFSSAALEPKPTYRCLQTYSFLSRLLRDVPLPPRNKLEDSSGSIKAVAGTTNSMGSPLVTEGKEDDEGDAWAGRGVVPRGGEGSRAWGSPEGLLGAIMPLGLGKKELTKGVLSSNSLLQASTMTLIADILDRGAQVIALEGYGLPNRSTFLTLLRQRLPEVQTLLGLRDRLGTGSQTGAGLGA